MATLFSETASVFVSRMPAPVVFWIVPPDGTEPVPATVRPAVVPVLLSTMPLTAPLAAIDWKFRPPVPIVVALTVNAAPVVVARVLPAPVAVTVPPSVAVNAGLVPVLASTSPLKATVVLALSSRKIPVPVSLMAPLMVTVPPVRSWISTDRPAVFVIDGPNVMLPVPPESLKSAPVTPLTVLEPPMSAVLTFVPLMPSPELAPTLMRRITLPLASVIAVPAAFWITGLAPAAGTRLTALTVRPWGSPVRLWLASSGRPPV